MRLSFALVLIATTGAAQPKPPVLAMDYVVGENIHIANQGGAINRHLKVEIRVELRKDNKVAATDVGDSREHNLYNNFTTDETQQWTNTWSGTWKQTATALSLDLVLANRTCTHTKDTSGGTVEKLPCRAVSKQIRFDCKTEQLSLRAPTPATGVKPTREVWQCLPAVATADFDLTPRTWSLGKTACVKVLGGRGGLLYESC
jgi:hypothetical protein